MVDIFDEVDEDLRAERLQKLLVRYGAWLGGAVLLVIAGAGAWQAWKWYQLRQDRAVASVYLAAMRDAGEQSEPVAAPDPKAAIAAFARVAASASPGYRPLAELQEAALRADTGDLPGALALWDAVAADSAASSILRSLASLLWVQHQIDKGDPSLLAARLAPLMSPDSPWRPLAEEAQALLDQRQGKAKEAEALWQGLAQDVTIPTGVRERASAMLARLGG